MDKVDRFLDSYVHYRTKTGYGPGHAVYRALFYVIKKRDPERKYLSFKCWMWEQWGRDLCMHNWCWREIRYQYRCGRHQNDP